PNLSIQNLYTHLYILYPFSILNNPNPTDIYTISLHDALPISAVAGAPVRSAATDGRGSPVPAARSEPVPAQQPRDGRRSDRAAGDRKSTRLNSSHVKNSYAVFSLKKKIQIPNSTINPNRYGL